MDLFAGSNTSIADKFSINSKDIGNAFSVD